MKPVAQTFLVVATQVEDVDNAYAEEQLRHVVHPPAPFPGAPLRHTQLPVGAAVVGDAVGAFVVGPGV